MKSVTALGSVRVDLVGGTLDINPIHLILPDVVTINVATGLKAEVQIEEYSFDGIEIVSKDYNSVYKFSSKDIIKENFDNDFFTEMSFVVQIINYFELTKNIKVSLKSGAPAGSGLGGSSAMGITLFKALCGFTERQFEKVKAFRIVQSIESRILNQGVPGYQDYYPALFGGVLALTPDFDEIKVEQCFTDELKDFLESHLTLVYSGKSRKSGINNWEVYKSFFDGNKETRDGMLEIASISNAAYKAMKSSNFSSLA
ncbi:MAG: D-glycero-alpha-D-manno-heptose-7-phosphate kinase, partial [Thermoproteota archaeon]